MVVTGGMVFVGAEVVVVGAADVTEGVVVVAFVQAVRLMTTKTIIQIDRYLTMGLKDLMDAPPIFVKISCIAFHFTQIEMIWTK